ncbi:MAG: FHA domain-containing protein [Ardenticatenaceae bacterium]|nr:FHA domain-containing protein [Ardenticatenaceae bacterium]
MEITLFLLRLISAILLLAFMGAIAWVMIRELQAVRLLTTAQNETFGRLLVVATDSEALINGAEFDLKPVTGIGRGLDNTIVLDDDFSSMHHALLTLRGQQWWLEDLHSSNGTMLNNEPIVQGVMVSSGDNITIGSTVFRLEL